MSGPVLNSATLAPSSRGDTMPIRFFRRVPIVPGIRINLARRPSITIGRGPFHATFGPSHVTTSAGIPGTGVSLRETHRFVKPPQKPQAPSAIRGMLWLVLIAIAAAALWRLARGG